MEPIPYDASLEAYTQAAQTLWSALTAGEDEAQWRFKWEHPRFRGKHVSEVKKSDLSLQDAELVIAQMYAFDTWRELETFTKAVKSDPKVARFEAAVESVINGDCGQRRRNFFAISKMFG